MSSDTVRRPRMRLVLNGVPVGGCRMAEITSLRASQASSFRITAGVTEIDRTLGIGWIDLDRVDVAIDFGLIPPEQGEGETSWMRMMTGAADRISLDPVSRQVSLDGRDQAARLIDLPVQESYLNKTSAEVAALLAAKCGLASDADPTQRLIGQYYQIQHSKTAFSSFSRHGNGWDLLAELAELEGYELWVDGTTLHFKQPTIGAGDVFDVAYSAPGASGGPCSLTVSSLALDRTFGLSDTIQVSVSSWNSRQRRQISAVHPGSVTGDAQQFLVLKPNLLPDDAERLARTTYARLRSHERVLSMTMAGELALTTRQRVRLAGTGTGWDGIYTVDRIEREMSLEHGFAQHVTARIEPDAGDGNG